MKWDWTKSIELEHQIAAVQADQELAGVKFDIDKAYDLVAELDDELLCIDHKLMEDLPRVLKILEKPLKDVKPNIKDRDYQLKVGKFEMKNWGRRGQRDFTRDIFRKDGKYTKIQENYWGDDVVNVAGAYCKVSFERFNLNSHDQVKSYLLSQGWQPTQWNYKLEGKRVVRDEHGQPIRTSPKLTEDSYGSIRGDKPQLLARRNVLLHRRNTVLNIKNPGEKGWIALVRDDGRIEAAGTPQATNTGRYRHSIVTNVPKAVDSVPFGYQMRELFTVKPGYKMLGCDAKGLEARMEAHYCYDFTGGHEYAHELIDGDIHTKNADVFGTDRDGAKSPKYALTYGAQPPKLAETIGCSIKRAQALYDAFWGSNTALAEFRDTVVAVWEGRGGKKGGYLKGLDGRKLFMRSPHSIVNCMFQSGGSIVVKIATVLLARWVKDQGLDARQVIHMHDEFQYEVREDQADILRELALKAFDEAGKVCGLNVPIEGDVKVGMNWAETH